MAETAHTSIEFASCENPGCKNTFKPRANRRSCSTRCRKALSRQSVLTVEIQTNSRPVVLKSKGQDCSSAYDVSSKLGHIYYSKNPAEREAFLRSMMQFGSRRKVGLPYRRAMTCPRLLHPPRGNNSVFHRRCPDSYRTFAQIADRYCRKVLGVPIQEYMKKPRNLDHFPLVHDMNQFDVPCFNKKQPVAMTEEQIRDKMIRPLKFSDRPRPQYLVDYYVRLFAARTQEDEKLAA